MRFEAHASWDEFLVYPKFVDWQINNAKILNNYIDQPIEDFKAQIGHLTEWVRTDYNRDHENGRKDTEINPTLHFIVGLFRMTQMYPWEWFGYFVTFTAELPFYLAPSVFSDYYAGMEDDDEDDWGDDDW